MLVFEYTSKFAIEPTSLINELPSIWRWSNPYIAISDWMFDLYGIDADTDPSMRFVFTDARVDFIRLSTVESYADCLATVNSFYWDNTNQVAYFHLLQHPHSYASMDMSALYGTVYGRPVEFNGLMYANTLKTKPTVEKNTEPVVYQKMGAQTLSIELINDELWGIDSTGKPYKYHRFDDTSNLNGQTTYLRYGENGETDYTKLKLLHKGIITKLTKTGTRLFLTCDDVRSKRDSEWPTFTYEDAGYTAEQVGEDILTKVIPDGFGANENAELICVNRDYAIIEKDEDDKIVLPTDQLLAWDMTDWIHSDVLITKRDSDLIGGFESYRIAKTAVNIDAKTYASFVATEGRHKISGFVRCDVENTPSGVTPIAVYNTEGTLFGEVLPTLATQTFDANGQRNARCRYNVAEDGRVTAYFSFETPLLTVGNTYRISIVPDNASQNASAIVVSGIRVGTVAYPAFRVARQLSSDTVHVYYEQDEELIEVTNIVELDKPNGIVYIHDVDAHEDGVITNGLRSLYCSATLRPETNPFDIITVLNTEVEGIPYIASFYDIDLCTTEKAKLAPVSLYADGTQKLNAVIEQLQSGSTVGFRYDDVDKIYIMCDDPNRPVARVIQSEEIVKKEDLELESDLTLYADEVTINYGVDRKASNPYKERNYDYKQSVLLRYNYTNPLTYESLLVSKEDARKKSIVLLEDLSVVRDKTHIQVNGLEILDSVDLYSIVRVNLQLSSERAFAGWLRMQVIGISVDTDFEFVTLHLRQRDYSEAFGDISGSYVAVSVLGYASVDDSVVVAVGQDETVVGFIEEE